MVDQKTVSDIYECYRRAMASVGRRVQLPANTDPSKTYAHRAVQKFVEEVSSWNLDKGVMRALVREIVRYGKRNGLLTKGTALLNMKSVLRICYEYLQREIDKTNNMIVSLEYSQQFLLEKAGNADVAKTLVTKGRREGYTNFTQWFRSNDISIAYMAISMACREALNQLPPDERNELPDDAVLLKHRVKILNNHRIREEASRILGGDILLSGISVEQ